MLRNETAFARFYDLIHRPETLSAWCRPSLVMDVLGPVLAAASRLVSHHGANKYCDQFNVTYEHRVDDPGASPGPLALSPEPWP